MVRFGLFSSIAYTGTATAGWLPATAGGVPATAGDVLATAGEFPVNTGGISNLPGAIAAHKALNR